jgi:hypothetical protein
MNTMATASMPSSKASAASRFAALLEIERRLDRAVGEAPLGDLDHALVEQLGQDDLLGEHVRAAPGRRCAARREALGDHQQRAVALALQQRVGGDRGAHLHRADALGRDRLPWSTPSRSRMPWTAASR